MTGNSIQWYIWAELIEFWTSSLRWSQISIQRNEDIISPRSQLLSKVVNHNSRRKCLVWREISEEKQTHTHVHKDEDYVRSDNYRHRVANTSRLSVDWIFAIAMQETSQPGQHDHDDADFLCLVVIAVFWYFHATETSGSISSTCMSTCSPCRLQIHRRCCFVF